MEIKQCKRCLYKSNHPLGLTIDEEGICSGCRIHEEKDNLNWKQRWEKLKSIIKPYKSRNKYNYDCIIPVTGGNDSYYIVHLAKNKLGLNPLLVSYNKYFNTPLGINNLSNLRIKFNCDIVIQNVNPLSVKKITKETLRRTGNIYWHCLAGQSVFPVQIALKYKVPLIIWGSHQGVEQVGMFSHTHAVEMTRRYRKDHDLMGIEADDLLNIENTLSEGDIWQYRYPSDYEINSIGIRGVYLGNYVRWDPKAQHEEMIKRYKYKTSSFPRTFDCYDYTDCYNYMDIHDLLKFFKHGYSKVTDHACREIRFGRITRNQAIKIVNHYQFKELRYEKLFAEWLDIPNESLTFLLNQFRNKNYWEEVDIGKWKFKESKIEKELSQKKINLILDEKSKFIENNNLDMGNKSKYIIFGKGYP